MRVVLAGYNIDAQVLQEARDAGIPGERLTPEVLSAAYARISRDPRPVGELRREALDQVEKARKSNRKIIFGMGHHSVAEHAVFNFDIVGISRLAIEALEHFRLCSFTEKSQRYITLDHDFVLPDELRGSPEEATLCSLVAEQARIYESLHGVLRRRLDDLHPDLNKTRSGKSLLDGWSKEDARYTTLLATSGQLGMTANGNADYSHSEEMAHVATHGLGIAASVGVGVIILTNLVLLPVIMSYAGVSPRGLRRIEQRQAADSHHWRLLSQCATPRFAALSLAGGVPVGDD